MSYAFRARFPISLNFLVAKSSSNMRDFGGNLKWPQLLIKSSKSLSFTINTTEVNILIELAFGVSLLVHAVGDNNNKRAKHKTSNSKPHQRGVIHLTFLGIVSFKALWVFFSVIRRKWFVLRVFFSVWERFLSADELRCLCNRARWEIKNQN